MTLIAVKLLIGSKKLGRCNDCTEVLYHHAKFDENLTTHVGVRRWSVMFFTVFVRLFVRFSCSTVLLTDYSGYCNKRFVSAFVGRFSWGLQFFFGAEKSFPVDRTDLKIVASCALRLIARMPDKILKFWVNGCKVCAHHFGHLEASWKKSFTTAFYPMYCRCAPV